VRSGQYYYISEKKGCDVSSELQDKDDLLTMTALDYFLFSSLSRFHVHDAEYVRSFSSAFG